MKPVSVMALSLALATGCNKTEGSAAPAGSAAPSGKAPAGAPSLRRLLRRPRRPASPSSPATSPRA